MSAVCAQNIHKTKYSSGTKTKLTSEENLLVGVEGVEDEGEELVDISREGVAFSVGGLLAEGRGIRKNCVAGCAQNTSAVRECCVVISNEKTTRATNAYSTELMAGKSSERGDMAGGKKVTPTSSRPPPATADHQSSHWLAFFICYARQEVSKNSTRCVADAPSLAPNMDVAERIHSIQDDEEDLPWLQRVGLR